MKIVIIEGPDNTGKTTVIHQLMEKYNNVLYIHATKPEEKDPILCALSQTKSFEQILDKIKCVAEKQLVDLVILDRSWLGEYVYGCLYRGNGEQYVKQMITDCYVKLYNICRNTEAGFETILYMASPEFCVRNDDGKSISEGRLDKITNEINRFTETFYDPDMNSKGHIHIINVEVDGKFRSKESIFEETLKII